MISYRKDMAREKKTEVRGGEGDVLMTAILEKMPLNCSLLKYIDLAPGSSIGSHVHEGNSELYIVLEGALTVTDDGEEFILQPGDAHCCFPDGIHGIANRSDAPGTFLAVVIEA